MCYGLSSALVYYNGPFDILAKFRTSIEPNKYLNELFGCMFCLPVNIGIIMSIISLLFASSTPFTPFTALLSGSMNLWPLMVVFDAFYTGAAVSIIDTIVDRLTREKVMAKDSEVISDIWSD
jgi:hypothetical protein